MCGWCLEDFPTDFLSPLGTHSSPSCVSSFTHLKWQPAWTNKTFLAWAHGPAMTLDSIFGWLVEITSQQAALYNSRRNGSVTDWLACSLFTRSEVTDILSLHTRSTSHLLFSSNLPVCFLRYQVSLLNWIGAPLVKRGPNACVLDKKFVFEVNSLWYFGQDVFGAGSWSESAMFSSVCLHEFGCSQRDIMILVVSSMKTSNTQVEIDQFIWLCLKTRFEFNCC